MNKRILDIFVCAFLMALAACSDDGKLAGVTEEDNSIAQDESSSSLGLSSSTPVMTVSSSSMSVLSSSSSGVAATPKFDLWNGADGEYKINTDNEMTGYWYSFGDDAEGGQSSVTYPVPLGNDYSSDFLDPVIDACGGLCGTVELLSDVSTPWAAVGFTLAEEDSTADISSWGGICVTYASEFPINVYLAVEVGGADTINEYASPLMAYPAITLPKTVTNAPTLLNIRDPNIVITRCAKWSDFRISDWAEYNKEKLSRVYSGEEAAKEIKAIDFVFLGSSGGKGEFNIVGISTYDENLPQWRDGGVNEQDVGLITDDSDSLTCLWKGLNGSGIVNTGYNDRDEFVGMLYDFDASPEGAYSRIEFPAYPNPEYEPYMYEPVIMECNGFCGTMEFTLEKADYAASAVAFNIAEDTLTSCEGNTCYGTPKFADIKDWGGLCITYYSEKDAYLNVVVKDVPYENSPKASLPASGGLIEKCVAWDDFQPSVPNLGTAVSTIQFIVKSTENGDRNQFNIAGIGKYSTKGACSIPKTVY